MTHTDPKVVRHDRVTDPVCGMVIDATSAAGSTDYRGHRYSFCSLACKAKFDADPAKYVSGGVGVSG